ncbi:hypothetical protein [Sphingopyxis lindanitolerans]|uniref:hypothetical protein n=1 Tax=Sphingopyxis lindanitolerans TaxID=2054227 RepID=UPI001F5B5939|nr:hypothetical protein [Sphingopyxis lindanitolerans]
MFRSLAGHESGDDKSAAKSPAKARQSRAKAAPPQSKAKPTAPNETKVEVGLGSSEGRKDMALTVRIEINLPANGSKETYDNIFKSIRANLYV